MTDNTTGKISLDGRVSSDLNWKIADDTAEQYQEKGISIFWNLDLGLFNFLKMPLSNQTQFLSLVLSIEHFQKTLWEKYKDISLGICIYHGSINFAQQIPWDEQLHNNYLSWGKQFLGKKFDENNAFFKNLFARDAMSEYLTLIVNRFPDSMPFFMIVDNDPSLSLAMEAQLTHREKFNRIHLKLTNNRLPVLASDKEASIGVCLPSSDLIDLAFLSKLEGVLENLLNKNIPFRIIPESLLINEWDGLDYLIVESSCLSSQGKRKLQGFCAAGGTLVNLGHSLNMPYEISIKDFNGQTGLIGRTGQSISSN